MKILLLLLLASTVSAREYRFTKEVNGLRLFSELQAAGFNVISMTSCPNCVLLMPDSETKDPYVVIAAHVPIDKRSRRQALVDELKALDAKLADGSATTADIRRAIRVLARLVVLTDQ